jgi:hypothetical protein
MQSLIEKINFGRKFTPDFAETIKPLKKRYKNMYNSSGINKKGRNLTKSRLPFLKLMFYATPISTRIYFFILLHLMSL